jgi:hypothetical protein
MRILFSANPRVKHMHELTLFNKTNGNNQLDQLKY